jgi:PTH1 family peptidyl-tRNA hydrolase
MLLLVGLGNPGAGYVGNRHNVGFMVVQAIAKRHGIGPWRRRFQGVAAEGPIGGERVQLLLPGTYMNESGRAVAEAANFYKLGLADIVVVHDEIELPPGKVRVKTGGGNVGHSGLRSISRSSATTIAACARVAIPATRIWCMPMCSTISPRTSGRGSRRSRYHG